MLLVPLLLLGAVALPTAQGIDLSSITSIGGDRTSLIFAPSSGQPASSPNPPEPIATTTPTPGSNDTDSSSVRPIKQIHPTRATPRATNGSISLDPLSNRTGGPMIMPFPRPNGTNVLPTLPPLNWTIPSMNWTLPGTNNGTFSTFPPNWTFPGANVSLNGTILFPPANWTLPPFNFSVPTTTTRPTNSTGSTTTPRPGTSPRPTPILWTWKPTNGSTGTTSRPGTGSTQRWTPPAWSNWNRSTTATSGTGSTRFPIGSSFGTTARPGTTSWPSFTGRFTFGPTPPYPSSPRHPSSPVYHPTTTTRSPLSTDVPNSLSQLLQTWRSRFVADMEAVRQNITQFLLH